MHPRVLIVGTVPFNTKSSSRAFDAYFHNWEKENIAQIFSNTKTPCKGHCGTLYQITDYRIMKRWFSSQVQTGKIFDYNDLPIEWENNDLEINSNSGNKAYKIGRKHTPFTHLLRGVLWREKYWKTKMLDKWLDDFNPQCVFLAFSDDYFINRIALYVAKKYNIPIVSCIGDDYYFNKHFSLNPIYQLYKETYKAMIRKVLKWPGSAIYISDKIRDKYNGEFNLDGQTVYLTSTVERKSFSMVDNKSPLITYFGNIRMGRNNSLCDIADALGAMNSNYRIEVYSNEQDPSYYQILQNNRFVIYGGSIPYAQVQEKMKSSDITVIVEGFQSKDIELSRYSLSTKAADALASGAMILTYGSDECGIIEYMRSTDASVVCSNKEELSKCLSKLLYDIEAQKSMYRQQIVMTESHHNISKSCEISEQIICKAINKKEGNIYHEK